MVKFWLLRFTKTIYTLRWLLIFVSFGREVGRGWPGADFVKNSVFTRAPLLKQFVVFWFVIYLPRMFWEIKSIARLKVSVVLVLISRLVAVAFGRRTTKVPVKQKREKNQHYLKVSWKPKVQISQLVITFFKFHIWQIRFRKGSILIPGF